jgi:membrane protein implicated in regulation of membrane protease activity
MGVGVFLVVLGAVLAFAVRGDTSAVDLQTAGLIFLVAGAAIIYYSRHGRAKVRETTVIDDNRDPARPVHTVHEEVVLQDGRLEP